MENNNEYTFYKGLDSFGYDSMCVGQKSVEELKKICNSNVNYIGFNTYGFIKHYICNISDLKPVASFKSPIEGVYVHNEKYNAQLKNMMKTFTYFDDYEFYSGLDSPGHDAVRVNPKMSLQDIKIMADKNNYLAFTTSGHIKSKICSPDKLTKLNTTQYNQGIYIKKQKFRIKLICDWTDNLCNEWNKMTKGNYTWNDMEFTNENTNIDFFVIINKPRSSNEFYIPDRTIVLQMEPWCYNPDQNWGVKTWGIWAKPSETTFLNVRPHTDYLNTTFWQLKTTYTEFKNTFNINKTKLMSSICSSKYFDPGHVKRIDFLKFVESKNDDLVKIDIYNKDNQHKFRNYVGPHPPNDKDVGIMPYKYYFMPENNEERNFITEKIWEPLLCECLCFYWGCPNISDWIDQRAIILLDMNDFEKSFNIVKNAILNDEWSKRIDVIRREKQKILDYYNFFPTLERIIKQDFKFNYKPSDEEVIYHKYFKDILEKDVNSVGFIHSCTVNDNIDVLTNIVNRVIDTGTLDNLDYLYIVNIGNKIAGHYDNDKIKIINYSENTQLFEKPTINLIHTFSQFHDCKVLYLHTKGISYTKQNNGILYTNVTDWTNYMLYFLLDKNEFCIDLLDVYNAVGCNYSENPRKHFSGNFWWADSKYIKKLTKISSNVRHDCEWYILSDNNVSLYNLCSSNVDHYKVSYPLNLYENKLDIDSFYNFNNNNRIKCVNLLRREDRKKEMTELFNKSNLDSYDFFEAVDGQKLVVTENILKLFKDNDFGSKKGVIGCALSHYEIWKSLIADTNYENYLVFEDDVEICDNFLFKFNHVLKLLNDKPDWDIVYLGYSTRSDKKYVNKELSIREYDLVNNIGGTFCYLISKSGANKFLTFIEQYGIKHGIDYLMFHYHKEMGLKQYQVVNPLVLSECARGNCIVDSDIQYDKTKLF